MIDENGNELPPADIGGIDAGDLVRVKGKLKIMQDQKYVIYADSIAKVETQKF